MELIAAKEFIIAAILGFIIGLQRELSFFHNNKKVYMGARTLSIISLTGYLSTKLYQNYPVILTVSFVSVSIFLFAFYFINAYNDKLERGNTTEFSALLTFIMGVLVCEHIELAVFSTVILIAILEIKPKLISIKQEIQEKDFRATILFLLMSFVVLPILPDKPIDGYGLINPNHIWMMVVLISGLSFIGYLTTKFIDTSKGLIMMGFFGGLASSTAITLTLSKKASKNKEANKSLAIAIAIALASSTMFIRVLIWTFILNQELFSAIFIPYLSATIVGYICIYYLYKNTNEKEISQDISFKNPLEFVEALKMGVIFGLVFGVLSLLNEHTGYLGVYFAAFISGLSDVDAIVLSITELFNNKNILVDIAIMGIILATIANTLTKLVLSAVIGNRSLARYLLFIFSACLSTLVGIFYILQI
ncbi:MAG: MgtC/SapB family protein [Campylobacterota bacterium]|nr:MgtC/SapB family protein [Campylobacterota bacterium]